METEISENSLNVHSKSTSGSSTEMNPTEENVYLKHLLEEKEEDLKTAAQLGQKLLEENKTLKEKFQHISQQYDILINSSSQTNENSCLNKLETMLEELQFENQLLKVQLEELKKNSELSERNQLELVHQLEEMKHKSEILSKNISKEKEANQRLKEENENQKQALQTASVKESEKSKEFRKLKNEHHKLSIRANNFDDIEDTIHSLEEENSKLQDILVHHKKLEQELERYKTEVNELKELVKDKEQLTEAIQYLMEENKKFNQLYQESQTLLQASQLNNQELQIQLEKSMEHPNNNVNVSLLSEIGIEQKISDETISLNDSNLQVHETLRVPEDHSSRSPSPLSDQNISDKPFPNNNNEVSPIIVSNLEEANGKLLASPLEKLLNSSPDPFSSIPKFSNKSSTFSLSSNVENVDNFPPRKSRTYSQSIPSQKIQDPLKAIETNRYMQKFHSPAVTSDILDDPLSSAFTVQEIENKVKEYQSRSAHFLERQKTSYHPLTEASVISQDELDLLNKQLSSAETRIKSNEDQINKLHKLLSTKSAIKEGWLLKKGTIFWRKRWFILAGVDSNLYYSERKNTRFLGVILLKGASTKVDSTGKIFFINTPDRIIELYCESEAVISEWITHIEAAISWHNEQEEKK